MIHPVFTVEQRDRVRDRVLEMARGDRRIVAGAMVVWPARRTYSC